MEIVPAEAPKKRCTSFDVARLAGVSRATVSHVLNGRRNATVPAETQERVQVAARTLGYKPNTLARSLRRGRTALVGVHISVREDNFHDRILHGIHDECDKQGYNVVLARFSQRGPAASAGFLRMMDFRVSGVIHVIGTLLPSESARLRENEEPFGVPTVLVDDSAGSDKCDCVITDDVEGARAAVRHLIELGHTRIAHITGGTLCSTAPARLNGYRSMVHEAGIDDDESLVQECEYTQMRLDAAVDRLLGLPNPPTAIFVANDKLAVRAIESARRRGIRIPEDISVIGYGDTEVGEYCDLSTVAQDPEELGRTAVRLIFERVADPRREPQLVMMPTRLIARGSTRPNSAKGSRP